MQTFHKVANVFGATSAIFRVPTTRGDVFMRIDRTPSQNDKRAVVEVEMSRFLAAWRREPHSIHEAEANGSPETWSMDRKFHWAEDGFAAGEQNPVPVARVGCAEYSLVRPIYKRRFWLFNRRAGAERESGSYACFTNGVTRTIWLATFGAKVFPVECGVTDAPQLAQVAGSTGRFYTVDELTQR
nr:hypothetical protein FFPRI1PSEUD_24650 [Pseudomonas sp. FFPRI_1]